MEIGRDAFHGCTGLTNFVIPDSLTEIGSWLPSPIAFNNCTGLKSIKVSEGNKMYDSLENCNAIIGTASNKLIIGCTTTVIPDSVTEIGEFVFDDCTGLMGSRRRMEFRRLVFSLPWSRIVVGKDN